MLSAIAFFLALHFTCCYVVQLSLIIAVAVGGQANKASISMQPLLLTSICWALFFYLCKGGY
jgi:hypothetical protein